MHKTGGKLRFVFPLVLILLPFTGALAAPAETPVNLDARPAVQQKQSEPLSEPSRRFLEDRNAETATVWLFFTDKGVFSQI